MDSAEDFTYFMALKNFLPFWLMRASIVVEILTVSSVLGNTGDSYDPTINL
jgi:hypothetical protein